MGSMAKSVRDGRTRNSKTSWSIGHRSRPRGNRYTCVWVCLFVCACSVTTHKKSSTHHNQYEARAKLDQLFRQLKSRRLDRDKRTCDRSRRLCKV